MCSHYLVTVLCWAYSNWDMFSSCKTKTPCLHNNTCAGLWNSCTSWGWLNHPLPPVIVTEKLALFL